MKVYFICLVKEKQKQQGKSENYESQGRLDTSISYKKIKTLADIRVHVITVALMK